MPTRVPRPCSRLVLAAAICLAAGAVGAQVGTAAPPARPGPGAESGPRWDQLSTPQRSALRPLQGEWSRIDAERKQKWLEIAGRYPSLPPAERERISARMEQWAKMTPAERGRARLNYQELRQLPVEERQARWEAYQALTPEQRKEFANRATPAPRPGPTPRAVEPVSTKSNLVPNPAFAAPRKPVAPTVVQAAPGATTSLVSRRPQPPTHQQPGLPKIAADPGFVDPTTLLPQRGPQAAAAARPPQRPPAGEPRR